MSNNTIKPLRVLAERMFPTFVAEDYPRMITFMKAVMDYMDQPGGQYDSVSHLLEYRDVDFTLEQFEDAFKKQYLRNFPDVLASDVDLLVKNIRSFYLNKGTEESFRFLFGALFQSTVNFRYPKFNVFRASDNLWYTPQFLVLTDQDDNIPPQILGGDPYDVSKLIDKFITGTTTGAVAFVDDDVTLGDEGLTYGGSGAVKGIQIVEGEGQFQPGEQIIIGDTIVENGDFNTGLNFWIPNYPGDVGFSAPTGTLRILQPLGIVQPRYVSQLVTVEETTQYWIRYSLVSASSAKTRVTVGYAPGSNEVYDSGEIGLSPGAQTVLMNATTSGVRQVYISIHNNMEYAGEECVYDGISLVKNNIQETPLLFIANIAAESGIITGESRWKDTRGFLSQGTKDQGKEIVLQDGYRYQDFSYEIKSQVSSNQFESIVRDLVHPAGFIMFADVVQADTIIDRYGMREYWFNTLVFDGAQTITKDPGDGPDFNDAFRYGDVLTIEGSVFSDGTYRVQDTPDSTTLVLKAGVNLAAENLVATPIQLQAGIGILPDGAQGESNLAYGLETLLDIANLGNATQYASKSLTFSGDQITDSYDFTVWFSPGDEITVNGTTLNDGTYNIIGVTATTITVSETFAAETPNTHYVALALTEPLDNRNYGLRIVPSDQYIQMAIEYLMSLGFGYTWSDAEKNRDPKLTVIQDWSSLVIGDFDVNASKRFGFIDPWEIESDSSFSTDPNILWGGGDYSPEVVTYAVGKRGETGYLEAHLTFPGTVIPGDTDAGGKYYETYKYQNFYAPAIVGTFGAGEYLGKYQEVSRPYTDAWPTDGIAVNGGTENADEDTWFDLLNLDFMLKNYWSGSVHEEIICKVFIATDDGFGNPIPGTDAWRNVRFVTSNYAAANNDAYDAFTTGGYLNNRVPDTYTSVGNWVNWTGNLRATLGHVTNDDDPTGTLSQAVLQGSTNNNVIETAVTFAATSNATAHALILRGADTSNYMRFEITDTTTANPVLNIKKVIAGASIVLSTTTLTGIGPLDGQTWTMRFAASDDQHLGTLLSPVTDNPQRVWHVTATDSDLLWNLYAGIELNDDVTFVEWCELNANEIGRIIVYPSPVLVHWANIERPNGISSANIDDQGSAYAYGNLYIYRNFGHGLTGPPWHTAAGFYWDWELNMFGALAVISESWDNGYFSVDEFVCKYDVIGEYGSGGNGGPLITFGNYTTGNEGIWFEAYQCNLDLEATVANPGPFETEIRLTVARDDGTGQPVAGTERSVDLMFIRHRQGDTRTVYDLFSGTNGTAISAHAPNIDTFAGGWTIQSGTPTIQTNAWKGAAAATNITTINTNVTDQCVWGKLQFIEGTPTGAPVGFILRWTDASNYWLCTVDNWDTADPSLNLIQVAAGVQTKKDSVVMIGAGPFTGEDYYCVLHFYVEGDMFRGRFVVGGGGTVGVEADGPLVAGGVWIVQAQSSVGNTSTIHGIYAENDNAVDYFTISNKFLGINTQDAPGFLLETLPAGTLQIYLEKDTSGWIGPDTDTILNGAPDIDHDYDFYVHWGDGTYDHVTGGSSGTYGTVSHTYTYSPTQRYPVRIEGQCPYFSVTNSSELKPRDILRWGEGSLKFKDLYTAFQDNTNLVCSAYDNLDLSECIDIRWMFEGTNIIGVPGNGDSIVNLNFTGTPIRALSGFLPNKWRGDLSGWDVSQITNFTDLFRLNHGYLSAGGFMSSINNWNVSNGKYFYYMFRESNINTDITSWNMANAIGTDYMFFYCHEFNQEVDSWNISSNLKSAHLMFANARDFAPTTLNSWDMSGCEDMGDMFAECYDFNADVTLWDVSANKNFDYMFGALYSNMAFNQDISGWTTTSAESMNGMFSHCNLFNHNITGWNVSNVTDFTNMFRYCDTFNQPVGAWTINTTAPGGVTMNGMFALCDLFNQPLNNWNMSNVTRVDDMFLYAIAFDSSLAGWNLSNCTIFNAMFDHASVFNQPINDWTLGSATQMEDMFAYAALFNQPLSTWDMTTVQSTDSMFLHAAAFNQDLTNWTFSVLNDTRWMFRSALAFTGVGVSGWNVSNVTNFSYMFDSTQNFDADLSGWDITSGTVFNNFLSNATGFSIANYDLLLNGWAAYSGSLSTGETLHVNQQFNAPISGAAHDILTGAPNNWTIVDLGGIGLWQRSIGDTLAPTVNDTSSVAIFGLVEKAASDILTPVIVDTSGLTIFGLVEKAASDTLAPTGVDSSALVISGLVEKAVSDTVAPLIVDAGVKFDPAASTLNNDLIAWYSMEEASGTRADSHTNGYDLTETGTVGQTTGKITNASQSIQSGGGMLSATIGAAPLLYPADSDFTLAGWVNVGDIVNSQGIIGAWDFSNGYSFSKGSVFSDRFEFFVKGSTALSAVSVSANTWYHFVCYHDATNNEIGISINNETFATTAHSTGINASSSAFGFQVHIPFNWATPTCTNRVDEVGFWSRLLTGTELTELWNGGAGIGYPG